MRMVPGGVHPGRGPTRGAGAAASGVSVALSSLFQHILLMLCTRVPECASLHISVGIHAYVFPLSH